MGDRGNIQITQNADGGTLYFYTHWSGSDIPQRLAYALDNMEGRLGDPSYATRIIFNQLQGNDRGTTGFGISLDHEVHNGHEIPHVDWSTADWGDEPVIRYAGDVWTPAEFHGKFGI